MVTEDSLIVELQNGTKIHFKKEGKTAYRFIMEIFDARRSEDDTFTFTGADWPIKVEFRLNELKSVETSYSEKINFYTMGEKSERKGNPVQKTGMEELGDNYGYSI